MVIPSQIIALIIGWIGDLLIGDPEKSPHPVVLMGKSIAFCEKKLNRGKWRKIKGALTAIVLVGITYGIWYGIDSFLSRWIWLQIVIEALFVYFCLAGTNLIKEVKAAFRAADESVEKGRKQVGRIVGRDTTHLTESEIKTASLETLSENLSDGVVAPLFWFMILGVPGMLAYKMVNTLDSMVGYKTERYKDFGCWSAKIDDIANYFPARLTAFLMVLLSGRPNLFIFVKNYGREHASPNSGYPEAALAGILDCRFGGTHDYFGQAVYKPYIGKTERLLTLEDLKISIRINRLVEVVMIALTIAGTYFRLWIIQS